MFKIRRVKHHIPVEGKRGHLPETRAPLMMECVPVSRLVAGAGSTDQPEGRRTESEGGQPSP